MPTKGKAGKEAKPAAAKSKGAGKGSSGHRVLDVLLEPCKVRQSLETLWDDGKEPSIPLSLDKYLIRASVNGDQTIAVRREFKPDQVRTQIRLPKLLTDWERLKEGDLLSSIPLDHRTYEQGGLVRDVAPEHKFEQEFMRTGFIETFQIMLVPVLTPEEETEFLANSDAFVAKMSTFAWFDDTSRVYWVCDGATRYTLAKKHGKSVYANFLRPDIPFETASMIANTHNEGTALFLCLKYTQYSTGVSHLSNETLLISKLRSIGRCLMSGQSQAGMQLMYSSWSMSGSTLSTLNQVYKHLSHYPTNWKAACQDMGVPKPLCRVTMAPWMSPTFKGLPSPTLQSECIAQMFARVEPNKGHEPYKFEDGKMLGTWNSPTTQVLQLVYSLVALGPHCT
jgi:hypothetical protein